MDTTHHTFLAVVWDILLLQRYLEGVRFTLRTDHNVFRWILNLSDLSGRLAR